MDTNRAVEFVRSGTYTDTPPAVESHLKARILDTLAAIVAGHRQEGVEIARNYALAHLSSSNEGTLATVLDGSMTMTSIEGAALANGVAANALDVDDGHREVKGHPAAVVIPPAIAVAEAVDASIHDLLNAVFVGYELAVRAGLAIHSVDETYTGTGSWGALGAAAVTARLFEFSTTQTAHALSIAEYHAPRTPIMRGVADPGMTKDGIGWGAYTGVVSAQLAEAGFTGSGTIFDEPSVDGRFQDPYHVTEGYFKPYPCCRWAQPGVEAVLTLQSHHEIDPANVESIRIATFDEATHLQTRTPATPEEAQYSYPYPVAAALDRGRFTQAEHAESARTDDAILALADRVELSLDDELDDRFPGECLARVTVTTGTETLRSDITRGRGAREAPLSSEDRLEKARRLVSPTLSENLVSNIESILDAEHDSVTRLVNKGLRSQDTSSPP